MKRLNAIAAAAMVAILAAAPAFAHHGQAAFDLDHVVTLTGKVTQFEFVNPHSQIYFDVVNAQGQAEPWQAELTAPLKLTRGGWTKRTLSAGDTITISGAVAKNGKHLMWVTKLIGPDGKPLSLNETAP
jgi:hypothetical protein